MAEATMIIDDMEVAMLEMDRVVGSTDDEI
jgi:hypothetical protein